MKRGSRASGTNPRALGTNPRAMRGVMSKAKRMGWNPDKQASPDGPPPWLRFEIFKRDGFRCTYCGASATAGAVLQVDHIKPKAAGGTDDPTNLTTSCDDCSGGKAARKLSETLI
jgi:5-methylcytosine-specific restriction endonuclease McrA